MRKGQLWLCCQLDGVTNIRRFLHEDSQYGHLDRKKLGLFMISHFYTETRLLIYRHISLIYPVTYYPQRALRLKCVGRDNFITIFSYIGIAAKLIRKITYAYEEQSNR